MTPDQERVIDAAERYANDLLGQASKYERLGQQAIADKTMREHFRPLREAIDAMKFDVERLALLREAGWEIADDGDPYRPTEVPSP